MVDALKVLVVGPQGDQDSFLFHGLVNPRRWQPNSLGYLSKIMPNRFSYLISMGYIECC
jgi:hypothetical protein